MSHLLSMLYTVLLCSHGGLKTTYKLVKENQNMDTTNYCAHCLENQHGNIVM